MFRRLSAVILAILFVFAVSAPPVFALPAEQSTAVKTAYGNTKDKLTDLAESTDWSDDSAWIVLALARAGELTEEQGTAYYNNIVSKLQAKGSAVLDEKNSSTNAKTVLALTAAGFDPTDVGGYDLLQPLSNLGYVRAQGMNGPVWALLAFDCYDYEIPVCDNPNAQTTRDNLIGAILGAQHADGGWSFSMGSDVDMTCMVMAALAPYYDTNETVRSAVDRGLVWLSSAQQEDGMFSSGGSVCSESASQVLVGLTSLGIDPSKDERFLKNNKGAIDALLHFYVQGGGFKHVDSNYKYNVLASMQGLYALVAWYRFQDGQNSLYDMTDASSHYSPNVDYEDEETPPDDPPAPPDDGQDDSGKDDGSGSGGSSADNGGTDNKSASADTKKPGGKTAGGTTKAGRIKLTEDEKNKVQSPMEHVLGMAKKALERDLPKAGGKYDGSKFSEADRIVLLDVLKAYQTLNAAEQRAVDKDEVWKTYMTAAAALGNSWHTDAKSGVDLMHNSEESLPWYVRLVVDPYTASTEESTRIAEALGEGGSLTALYDVHFVNMLDGKEWVPDHILTVRIPVPKEVGEQPIVVHLTKDGKIELLDCSLAEDGAYAEFSAAEFSPYGLASIEGSLDERLAAPAGEDLGEPAKGHGSSLTGLLPWAAAGGLGLLALLALLVLRRKADDNEGTD